MEMKTLILLIASALPLFGQLSIDNPFFPAGLLKSSATPVSLYTNYIATSTRSDSLKYNGMNFTNTSSITVTHLGRWVWAGNTGTRTVTLVLWTNKTSVASATVDVSGTTNQFAYTALASPVTLLTNTMYAIVSTETSGQIWGNAQSGTNAKLSSGTFYSGCYSSSTLAALTDIGPFAGRPYVPTDLKYTP